MLATANPHKVRELRAIFAPVGLRVLALDDLAGPGWREPEETGLTFEDNATIKARSYAQQTGHHCLADDSGLEVDALAGRPGVISSHYASDGRETGLTRAQRDQANNQRLLRELADVPMERRGARFVCVMVLADPSGRALLAARGQLEGRIGVPPRVPAGAEGFGYDPLFLIGPQHVNTSAELTPDQKNALSHRAHAARSMAALIANMRRIEPPTACS